MDYVKAREYITGLQKSGIRLGLERMHMLMEVLGNPQDDLKFIHVAGTNGKGSTCTFICAMLAENGYKTGMYLSPAVEDVREQYVINGEWISKEEYAECASNVCEAANEISPTSYEFETAMAFVYFASKKCDLVVLETGLGGREDATNIVNTTVLSVLTSISNDHLGMIGNNINEIARTKAGIIKTNVPVIMMENIPEVESIVQDECSLKGSKMYVFDRSSLNIYEHDILAEPGNCIEFDIKEHKDIKINASGIYQVDNAALALEALDVLAKYDKTIILDEEKCREALIKVKMPYRMEKISDDPLFYVDGAHNPDAAKRLRQTIEEMFSGYKLIFIMGMFKDKDYKEVVSIMAPLSECIYTVQTPDSTRALSAEKLSECIKETLKAKNIKIKAFSDIEEAVKESISTADGYANKGERLCILAFGSLSYLKYIKQYISASMDQTEGCNKLKRDVI